MRRCLGEARAGGTILGYRGDVNEALLGLKPFRSFSLLRLMRGGRHCRWIVGLVVHAKKVTVDRRPPMEP